MRLHFTTTQSTALVAVHEVQIRGFVNQWIISSGHEKNSQHDSLSLYSVSKIKGTYLVKNNLLSLSNGIKFFISSYDIEITKSILRNVRLHPKLFADIEVTTIDIEETPVFPGSAYFFAAAPILVKRFDGKTIRHLTFDNPEANDVMTKTIQTKLRTAGLDAHAESVRIRFDTGYTGAKTKLVDVHGIKNRANICPIIVEGSPEAVAFVWDVGVGHSTGAGFGAVSVEKF